ncbi:hypothetical protein M413DRAFT_15448 [Hebeloma cylindrosporum]|uniref:Cytosine-specific methyltransferase n=1 Tax=Hebeloma cylindrosporum TaxID=76867 RepID=A0A0C3CZP6_HEBCY|nr:hypothetical protein M413DRAFT_15448 [Hebeloma cylindrosporum h7]
MPPRLVPYVEILFDPSKRPRRHRSPSPATSSSSLSTRATSPNLSPRKKRKLDVTDDEIVNNLHGVRLGRPLSPTASEFSLESLVDVRADDIKEDENLYVDGETPPEEEDGMDIPVRLLSDFTIYNASTLQAVPVAELLQLSFSQDEFRASGLVKAWIDDLDIESDISDEDSGSGVGESDPVEGIERVTLSEILEFSIHNKSEDDDGLDSKIYLRTKFAWYILGIPSSTYKPYFAPFWIQQRILHLLVIGSTKNRRLTYSEFQNTIATLDEDEVSVPTSNDLLGRELGGQDLKADEVIAYLVSSLPEVCSENHIQISRVPAVREIMGAAFYNFDDDLPQQKVKSRKTIPASSRPTRRFGNKEKDVLLHRHPTFLTPTVNRIAKNLFEVSLEVAKSKLEDESDDSERPRLPRHKGHYSDPQNVTWGDEIFKGSKIFRSAIVDGVIYNAGDIVMVEPDISFKDGNHNPEASETVNKYGNHWWFCQIRYFHEKVISGKKRKLFHGLWLVHGSKTILQEVSHSKALYMLGTCDDNSVSTIFKKCHVNFMRPGDEEALDDGSRDSNDFHCSLRYNEEHAEFVDIPSDALAISNSEATCYSCELKADECDVMKVHHPDDNSLICHGIEYHTHEFVYIHPSKNTKLLSIGQITAIEDDNVFVTFLGRYDSFRRLFFTDKQGIISADKLDGICHVYHMTDKLKIERWVQHDDHYYLNQEGSKNELSAMSRLDFQYCKPCHLKDKERRLQVERFKRTNSKVVGMELFSGAGGLGVGMDLSEFVETKYAVEFSPSAAKTYMRNHPETTVYCQDTNALLKHIVDHTPPLYSLIDGKTRCPPLPDKNKEPIDFIFGGPPCQSFSLANHTKRRDDVRSTLACNMLSYVEHYEPNYFLLENVFGFLHHKFHSTRSTDSGEVNCVIQAGMVKFVARTLIALGYQVRFKMLQAAQYGIPQSRRRVIFWGAKRGIAIPDFPVPVYAYPQGANRVSLPTGKFLTPPTRCKEPGEFHSYAPLPAITVNTALGDLNPHHYISATKQDRKTAKKREEELGIPAVDAVLENSPRDFSSLPGYPDGAPYHLEPQNRFQIWLRRGLEKDDEVTGHYTRRMGSRTIEATVVVPLRPLADHRDVPGILLPDYARRSKQNTFFGRMDGDGFFKCAVTTLSPLLKNQWPLHPSQKRIVTVREAARSQGFPDTHVFESINTTPSKIIEDQLRQIGNAVAVPFALALGKELGKAMILEWEKHEREGSVVL